MRVPGEELRSIAGRHNPLIKQLRQGFAQGELTAGGYCSIEGFRIIEEAIRSGLKLRALFLSESAQERADRLLPQIGSRVETVLVPDQLFTRVVPSLSPQGVAALVEVKRFRLEQLLGSSAERPLVVIAGVQDPGNLGTIVRSAEAFGASGAALGEGTVSAYNTKVIRASAGSSFRLPMMKVEVAKIVPLLRAEGARLLATSSHKGTPAYQCDLRGKSAIFVGNEGAGVSKRLLPDMDELVLIPHSPRVESLNAGVAASIILYEVARQKMSAARVEDRARERDENHGAE